MGDKVKEDLSKKIFNHFDLKENTKFIVYFSLKSAACSQDKTCELILSVTNGVAVWSTCLTSDVFLNEVIKKQALNVTFEEFLTDLSKLLHADEFELNKIFSTESSSDLIEFQSCFKQVDSDVKKLRKNSFKFLLEPAKSSANEIKNLLFQIYEKLNKAEFEFEKLANKSSIDAFKATSNKTDTTNSNSKILKNESNDLLRRFNIASVASSNSRRKPGMSIINPMAKKRIAPKGVEFDDDNDNSNDEAESLPS